MYYLVRSLPSLLHNINYYCSYYMYLLVPYLVLYLYAWGTALGRLKFPTSAPNVTTTTTRCTAALDLFDGRFHYLRILLLYSLLFLVFT